MTRRSPHFAVQPIHVHEDVDHEVRAICLRGVVHNLGATGLRVLRAVATGRGCGGGQIFCLSSGPLPRSTNARFRCEEAEFLDTPLSMRRLSVSAIAHELIDIGFDAFVEVVVEEAFEYEVSLFVELGRCRRV